MLVVLLSGEIATGKTAVADCLVSAHGFVRASTSKYLFARAEERGLAPERDVLKQLGDALDEENGGRWVAELVSQQVAALPERTRWLLDSVRRDFQIPWFRKLFQHVLHVHLTAPDDEKRQRYEKRRSAGGEYSQSTSYEEAITGPTEIHVRTLSKSCDLLIDTAKHTPMSAALEIFESAIAICNS